MQERKAKTVLWLFCKDVAIIPPLTILESELAYSYPFQNGSLQNEGHFATCSIKLVTMATSLENSEKKRSRSIIYEQIRIIP